MLRWSCTSSAESCHTAYAAEGAETPRVFDAFNAPSDSTCGGTPPSVRPGSAPAVGSVVAPLLPARSVTVPPFKSMAPATVTPMLCTVGATVYAKVNAGVPLPLT